MPQKTPKRDEAYDLMELTGGTVPEYKQMMDYLMARRAVPPVQLRNMRDYYGLYEHPGARATSYVRAPQTGRITVSPNSNSDATLVHETVHAVEREIGNQYFEEKYPHGAFNIFRSPAKGNAFTDAMEKTRLAPRDESTLERLSPDWKNAEAGYRATDSEANAFALQHSTVPASIEPTRRAPLHVDPTLATEFLILLDLAARSQAKKPQSQGR